MPCVFHLLINQALMSKVKMINFRNLAPYVSLLLLKLKVQKQKDGEIMTHFLDGARKLFWIFHSIWKSPKMSDLVSLLNKVENENFWSDFQTLWLLLIRVTNFAADAILFGQFSREFELCSFFASELHYFTVHFSNSWRVARMGVAD